MKSLGFTDALQTRRRQHKRSFTVPCSGRITIILAVSIYIIGQVILVFYSNTVKLTSLSNRYQQPITRRRFSWDKSPLVVTNDFVSRSLPSLTSDQFHLVFSTGCSVGQDWQSYVLFYHILHSGQEGNVTRVASGCSDDQAQALQTQFARTIRPMSNRFHLHLTPDYSRIVPNVHYKFFNKPFGLKHWVNNGLRFVENKEKYDNVIFIILDPDQIILRPFQFTFNETNSSIIWHKKAPVLHRTVSHGHPMAQLYMFGGEWSKGLVVSDILRAATTKNSNHNYNNSILHNWTPAEVHSYYAAGPPYVATGRDFHRLIETWANVATVVYKQTQDFLSEMFAYSVAAAALNLPHQLVYSFMVSHPEVNQEGWETVDAASTQELFETSYSTLNGSLMLPNVLHYCQRYHLGPWFFSKYRVAPDFFIDCQHALFDEPTCCNHPAVNANASASKTVATTNFTTLDMAYNWSYSGPPKKEVVLMKNAKVRKRHAFMLHHLLTKINQASVYYKQQFCSTNDSNVVVNMNKSFLW